MGYFADLLVKYIPENALSHSMFPPASNFLPSRDLPELTEKTIIVTGGNTGVGRETCKQLLLKGAKVYLAARSAERGQKAIDELETETGKKAIFLKLDLADLKSVRKAVEEFMGKEGKLDVLFNNAGVMICPTDMLSVQGGDLQFFTNTLGHYFLTILLLPALSSSAKVTGVKARVINTSSSAHNFPADNDSGIEFSSLIAGPEREAWIKKFSDTNARWRLYGQSKLGNILVANYLARTYPDVLVSCAVHPGFIVTDLQRHGPALVRTITSYILHPPSSGALGQLWAGTIADPQVVNSQYIIPWARIGTPPPQGQNQDTEKKVIEFMDEQLKGF